MYNTKDSFVKWRSEQNELVRFVLYKCEQDTSGVSLLTMLIYY